MAARQEGKLHCDPPIGGATGREWVPEEPCRPVPQRCRVTAMGKAVHPKYLLQEGPVPSWSRCQGGPHPRSRVQAQVAKDKLVRLLGSVRSGLRMQSVCLVDCRWEMDRGAPEMATSRRLHGAQLQRPRHLPEGYRACHLPEVRGLKGG